MDELVRLYDRDDFKQVWRSVSADIKIRTYQKLNDLPLIQNLPSSVQTQIYSAANNMNFNYETVVDEGVLYNTAYVVLFDQNKENWMGMYQYNYATTLSKGLAIVLGLGVCIGGIYYFSTAAAQHVSSVIGFISENYAWLQNAIIKYAGIIFSVATFNAFRKWLLNEHSEWRILVAACILKKIQSIRGY
jgi:hypothetical protein